jgi:hypothetical protein
MRRFRRTKFDIEEELGRHRPTPGPELVAAVKEDVGRTRRGSPRRVPALRLAFVTALIGALVAASAATGAFHYARHGFVHAVRPHHAKSHARQFTPAQDQYKPGCGKGDKNHEHTGPPGKHNGFPGTCPPNAGGGGGGGGKKK